MSMSYVYVYVPSTTHPPHPMLLAILTVAFIWGVTNPLIRYGGLQLQKQKRSRERPGQSTSKLHRLQCDLLCLVQCWQYTIPLLVNLTGSLLFVHSLSSGSTTHMRRASQHRTDFDRTTDQFFDLGYRNHCW